MAKFLSQWFHGLLLLICLGALGGGSAALNQSSASMHYAVGISIGLAFFVLVPWLSYHIAHFLVISPPEEVEEQSAVEEMFNKAFSLDRRGDWAEAIDLYERIADMSPEQQEGEYARNCAEQIREKMRMAEDA